MRDWRHRGLHHSLKKRTDADVAPSYEGSIKGPIHGVAVEKRREKIADVERREK